ncbi:MAG: DNA-directed RNA polymerase core subunit rpc10 [Icmadophila ericetorum]|nr:DNA-directed RNA polymerase core subunit rpc10 [Icmadophila ericetorum]
MSHEAYRAPTTAGAGAAGTTYGSTSAIDQIGPVTQYLCGECNAKVQLRKGDAIRCKECGHRVLYKERTKRYVTLGHHEGELGWSEE